ncbi:MAG TPA: WbqC family protein [Puia sp.]
MNLGIMQPYIFPYTGYYQLINAVDEFVIYDDVNYINKGWINRNNLLVNGKAFLFTVPLKEASQNKLINQIEIQENESWAKKFLKTIEQAYKKAPHFKNTFSLVSDVINSPVKGIHELALLSLKSIADYLDIKTEFVDSSSLYQNTNLKAQDRILDICLREKSDHYINPIGGMEIYSNEMFERSGIKLSFLKTIPVPYTQFDNEFVPYLSIIDVLMFNSKAESIELINQYELINVPNT